MTAKKKEVAGFPTLKRIAKKCEGKRMGDANLPNKAALPLMGARHTLQKRQIKKHVYEKR